MSDDESDHSNENGHWSKCDCDLCETDETYHTGFYSCTCYQCDRQAISCSYANCEQRHTAICGCGSTVVTCQHYAHDRSSSDSRYSITHMCCDCDYCNKRPIFKCEDGCPICSKSKFIAVMRYRYEESLADLEDSTTLAIRDSPSYKFVIQKFLSPVKNEYEIWVTTTPKYAPYEPVIHAYAIDIIDAQKYICETIEAAKQISDLEFERCLDILASDCQKMSTADKLLASEIDDIIDTNKLSHVHESDEIIARSF